MLPYGKIKEKKNVTFVLTAGGSRAAFQWGVIQALWENGIRPDRVWGVSGGSINAALLGTKSYDLMRSVWNTMGQSWVFKGNPVWRVATMKPSLYTLDPLEERLRNILGSNPLQIPVSTLAVSVNTGNVRVFNHDDEYFIRGLRASASIPGVFDPCEIDGENYVDGGVRDYSPLKYVIGDKYESDMIVAISSKPKHKQFNNDFGKWRRIWEILSAVVPISMEEMFQSDFRMFEAINHAVRQAEKRGVDLYHPSGRKYRAFDYLYIEPPNLGSGMDFSRKNIDEMIEIGYEIGMEKVDRAKQLNGN